MAFNSYRYPRHHRLPPTPGDAPWSPIGSVDPKAAEKDADGEIDLATIDLREAEGTLTRF